MTASEMSTQAGNRPQFAGMPQRLASDGDDPARTHLARHSCLNCS